MNNLIYRLPEWNRIFFLKKIYEIFYIFENTKKNFKIKKNVFQTGIQIGFHRDYFRKVYLDFSVFLLKKNVFYVLRIKSVKAKLHIRH